MKYFCETYDSVDAMLRIIDERPENDGFKGRSPESKSTGDAKWYGTDSYEEAVELIRNGWEEPLKDLRESLKTVGIRTNVTTDKVRPCNRVVGYAPHVPNAIRGIPESMIATERTPNKVKAVTIIYSSDSNANVTRKQFLDAGAVILNIINDLELRGYRVRLIHEFCGATKGEECLIGRVTLKDWRQPLDLKKLTFPLANAAMIRRFGFRFTETVPGISKGWSGGYGSAMNTTRPYGDICDTMRKAKLLNENEYFINIRLIQAYDHDSEKVMKAAGMTLK